jgi:hypothetical protein
LRNLGHWAWEKLLDEFCSGLSVTRSRVIPRLRSRVYLAPVAGRAHLEAAVLIGRHVFGDQEDNRVDAIDSVMPRSRIDEIEPSLAVVS